MTHSSSILTSKASSGFKCVPSREKLPSLLSWIQRYGSAVREYTHCNSPDFELALGALLSHGAPLHTLMLGEPPDTLHMVAAFTTIRHCSLESTWETPRLDLQPMPAMPELVNLTLINGRFKNLQAAAQHLTRLQLEQCIAKCTGSCMCTTSLLELHMEEANLEGLSDRGIVDCCCLQTLDCLDGFVGAGLELHEAENLTFKDSIPQVPLSLTALTSLTKLCFECYIPDAVMVLDWVTSLSALQQLRASVQCNIVLPQCLSSMTKLTHFHVRTVSIGEESFWVKPRFKWKALAALQCIRFDGTVRVSERFRLSDLATLENLHTVIFSRCFRPEMCTMNQLAALAYSLGRERPDVRFTASPVFTYMSE